jgi:DNA-binding transcriptional ArsR family regulator
MNDPGPEDVLRHPLRARIFALLEQEVRSPLELSRTLRMPLGVVAYHVRKLHELGLIELVRETRVRGAIQRHFRAREGAVVPMSGWSDRPVAKPSVVAAALDEIVELARASNARGGFDARGARVTREKLRLDREGWERLAARLQELLHEAEAIEDEAKARQAAAPDQVALVIMQFVGEDPADFPG